MKRRQSKFASRRVPNSAKKRCWRERIFLGGGHRFEEVPVELYTPQEKCSRRGEEGLNLSKNGKVKGDSTKARLHQTQKRRCYGIRKGEVTQLL